MKKGEKNTEMFQLKQNGLNLVRNGTRSDYVGAYLHVGKKEPLDYSVEEMTGYYMFWYGDYCLYAFLSNLPKADDWANPKKRENILVFSAFIQIFNGLSGASAPAASGAFQNMTGLLIHIAAPVSFCHFARISKKREPSLEFQKLR